MQDLRMFSVNLRDFFYQKPDGSIVNQNSKILADEGSCGKT